MPQSWFDNFAILQVSDYRLCEDLFNEMFQLRNRDILETFSYIKLLIS